MSHLRNIFTRQNYKTSSLFLIFLSNIGKSIIDNIVTLQSFFKNSSLTMTLKTFHPIKQLRIHKKIRQILNKHNKIR